MVYQPRERTGVMLAYGYNPKRLLKYEKPFIVQPKVEGDRRRALVTPHGVELLTSTAMPSISTPHIRKAIEQLSLQHVEFDGEIYRHGESHSWIRSRAAPTKNIHPDHENLEYHIFDLAMEDVIEMERQQLLDDLSELFQPPLVRVPWELCHSEEELEEFFDMYIKQGYEGIIIREPKTQYLRRRTTTMMKLKPRQRELFLIVGYAEEKDIRTGKPKGCLGSVEMRGLDSENTFWVGSGFTDEQRKRLWENPKQMLLKMGLIAFQSYTKKRHVPKMTSFKGFVIPGDKTVRRYPW